MKPLLLKGSFFLDKNLTIYIKFRNKKFNSILLKLINHSLEKNMLLYKKIQVNLHDLNSNVLLI